MAVHHVDNPVVRLHQWAGRCRQLLEQSPLTFFDECFVRTLFHPSCFRCVIKRWLVVTAPASTDPLDTEKLALLLKHLFEFMCRAGTDMRLVLTAQYIDFFADDKYRIPLADLPSEVLVAIAMLSGGHYREFFTVQRATVNDCELSGCRFRVTLPMPAVIESIISLFAGSRPSVRQFHRFLSSLTARCAHLQQRWLVTFIASHYLCN